MISRLLTAALLVIATSAPAGAAELSAWSGLTLAGSLSAWMVTIS